MRLRTIIMTPQQFRESRIQLGLTLAEMATAIGMSVTAVKHMEMTSGSPSARSVPQPVAKLVRAYLNFGYKPEEQK